MELLKSRSGLFLIGRNAKYLKPFEIHFEVVKYGLLYNYFSVIDPRSIANTGWSVPSNAQIQTLATYLGGWGIAGGKLKETGNIYWSNNIGATNEAGFNFRGTGSRSPGGPFSGQGSIGGSWGSDYSLIYGSGMICFSNNTNLGTQSGGNEDQKKVGWGLRLIKNSTNLTHGQTGTYIGNDKKGYRTIAIGNPAQEWLACNLAETCFRNGDLIPEVTENAAWEALTTGAMCAYNNDWSNV